jgi:hypothetical protein
LLLGKGVLGGQSSYWFRMFETTRLRTLSILPKQEAFVHQLEFSSSGAIPLRGRGIAGLSDSTQ